jgi:hypothetical protein
MSIKLANAKLVLNAAAQREDLYLVAPPTLEGATPQKVARKLISARFVKEVKTKASDPVWRRDSESDGRKGRPDARIVSGETVRCAVKHHLGDD